MLYRWYVQFGHARNENDEKDIKAFFKSNVPPNEKDINGFTKNYTSIKAIAGMLLFVKIF